MANILQVIGNRRENIKYSIDLIKSNTRAVSMVQIYGDPYNIVSVDTDRLVKFLESEIKELDNEIKNMAND